MDILEEKQSELITAIRFPLMILVVFIHAIPVNLFEYPTIFENINFYKVVSIGISRNLAVIAVPCFFLISGFLFFKKIDVFTKQVYATQLKKRIRTLLVPYLLWNLIFIGVILFKNYLLMKTGAEGDYHYDWLHHHSITALFWSGPAPVNYPVNYPLWYLRDLICMVVLTPVFYFYCRYLGIFGLVFLILINFSGIKTNIPGLDINGLTYFGIGAYLSLNKRNMLMVFARFKYSCLAAAVLFGILAYCYIDSSWFTPLNRVYVFFGVVSFFNMINFMIRNDHVKNTLMWLSAPVFFIYCVHAIYFIEVLRGIFSTLPLAHSEWGLIVTYFSLPCIVLVVCIILRRISYHFFPAVVNVLLGERK